MLLSLLYSICIYIYTYIYIHKYIYIYIYIYWSFITGFVSRKQIGYPKIQWFISILVINIAIWVLYHCILLFLDTHTKKKHSVGCISHYIPSISHWIPLNRWLNQHLYWETGIHHWLMIAVSIRTKKNPRIGRRENMQETPYIHTYIYIFIKFINPILVVKRCKNHGFR